MSEVDDLLIVCTTSKSYKMELKKKLDLEKLEHNSQYRHIPPPTTGGRQRIRASCSVGCGSLVVTDWCTKFDQSGADRGGLRYGNHHRRHVTGWPPPGRTHSTRSADDADQPAGEHRNWGERHLDKDHLLRAGYGNGYRLCKDTIDGFFDRTGLQYPE